MSQKLLFEKRKRNEWFNRRELIRLEREKKHGTSGGKKEEETYGRNTKQLEMNM